MATKLIQYLSIGDKAFKIKVEISRDEAFELHQMVGQVFVLGAVNWVEGDQGVLEFVPGNGCLTLTT